MGVVTFCCWGGSAVLAVQAWVLLILRRVGRRRARVKTPLQRQGMRLCDLVEDGSGREKDEERKSERRIDRQEREEGVG
jgi:hypothetical protein